MTWLGVSCRQRVQLLPDFRVKHTRSQQYHFQFSTASTWSFKEVFQRGLSKTTVHPQYSPFKNLNLAINASILLPKYLIKLYNVRLDQSSVAICPNILVSTISCIDYCYRIILYLLMSNFHLHGFFMAFDETLDTELIELGIFLRVSKPFIGSNVRLDASVYQCFSKDCGRGF